MIIFIYFLCYSICLFSEPPKEIPSNLYNDYTLNGMIPVNYWYFDNSYPPNAPIIFKIEEINKYICNAKAHKQFYYGKTDLYLYQGLEKYISYVKEKNIAIIGSVEPWYESIVLAYEGNPTTIEYNKIISEDPRIKVLTVNEYDEHPYQFDAILSISSIEHDGLGRYGDPINPFGDIEAMQKIKKMLKKGGLLFLAVPIGVDCIVWNAHRIYGKIRLELLFDGWEIVDSFGFSKADLAIKHRHYQPVFVLKSKN